MIFIYHCQYFRVSPFVHLDADKDENEEADTSDVGIYDTDHCECIVDAM